METFFMPAVRWPVQRKRPVACGQAQRNVRVSQ